MLMLGGWYQTDDGDDLMVTMRLHSLLAVTAPHTVVITREPTVADNLSGTEEQYIPHMYVKKVEEGAATSQAVT
jgi:hypothetical protein